MRKKTRDYRTFTFRNGSLYTAYTAARGGWVVHKSSENISITETGDTRKKAFRNLRGKVVRHVKERLSYGRLGV